MTRNHTSGRSRGLNHRANLRHHLQGHLGAAWVHPLPQLSPLSLTRCPLLRPRSLTRCPLLRPRSLTRCPLLRPRASSHLLPAGWQPCPTSASASETHLKRIFSASASHHPLRLLVVSRVLVWEVPWALLSAAMWVLPSGAMWGSGPEWRALLLGLGKAHK